MKKLLRTVVVCLFVNALVPRSQATEPVTPKIVTEKTVQQYISNVYSMIPFSADDSIDFNVFSNAMHGYLNLWEAGKLGPAKNIITICDLSRSANRKRLWIVDLDKKQIIYHTYVAHGQGSGEEFARSFSNRNNSHQTSLGFYVTGETYMGEHGLSLRLGGMDNGFNSLAFDRGIVVHGADYVSTDFIAGNLRLGRSWGCPAVPMNLSADIINVIKDSTCLFIYYPDKKYLARSLWLKRKPGSLPELSNNFALLQSTAAAPVQHTVQVEYMSQDSLRNLSPRLLRVERIRQ